MIKQYDLTVSQLIRFILDLNEVQRKAFLEMGEQLNVRGIRASRTNCRIPLKYSTFDRIFYGNILNLSHNGAFIETKRPVFVGEDIIMQFEIDGIKESIEIKGEVVHASHKGVGIRFTGFNRYVLDYIKRLLKKNSGRRSKRHA